MTANPYLGPPIDSPSPLCLLCHVGIALANSAYCEPCLDDLIGRSEDDDLAEALTDVLDDDSPF